MDRAANEVVAVVRALVVVWPENRAANGAFVSVNQAVATAVVAVDEPETLTVAVVVVALSPKASRVVELYAEIFAVADVKFDWPTNVVVFVNWTPHCRFSGAFEIVVFVVADSLCYVRCPQEA